MANSLSTGVSGLSSHQKMLEVIGNNLANLNTTAYKSRRTLFSDLFQETVQSASRGTPGVVGGTNPVQVGTGSRVSQIDLLLTQGNLVSTGSSLDLGIEGQGYFVVATPTETLYTRAGAFKVDDNGILVDPSTGYRVQRFGTVGEAGATGGGFQVAGDNDIRIPFGATVPGRVTTEITLKGNLPSDARGPVQEVLLNQSAWMAGGVPATAATLLNALDANVIDYIAGDALSISGTDADGSSVAGSLNLTGASTVGDLMNAINTAFAGATASLNPDGRIQLTADTPGEAFLSLSIADALANTGATAFSSNSFLVETNGARGDVVRSGVEIFDSRGGGHLVELEFEKQTNGSWTLAGDLDPADGTVVDGSVTGIVFNSDGSLAQAGGIGVGNSVFSFQFAGSTEPQEVILSFGSQGKFDGMTELAGESSIGAEQDGLETGTLSTVQVGADGTVNGIASNGAIVPLAQLAIANFRNVHGLDSRGRNYFTVSPSSGAAELGNGLTGSRGAVRGGQLEQSNVDIAEQFTQLIVAQRGFSANARTITVANEILEEATNLIR